MLLDNIEDDFCLLDAPMSTERYAVCISYRKDTDGSKAGYIEERLRPHVEKIFLEPVSGKPTPPRRQIAGAVCNSKVIILILSKNSFADIDTLTNSSQASKRHEELANLLRQMDKILEVHEQIKPTHHQHRVKPVRVLAGAQTPAISFAGPSARAFTRVWHVYLGQRMRERERER